MNQEHQNNGGKMKNNGKPRSKSPRKPNWKNKGNQKPSNPPKNQQGSQGGNTQGYHHDPYYHNQDRRDPRDYHAPPQYHHTGGQPHAYYQRGPPNYEHHQYDVRRSPVSTHNHYEPLSSYREDVDPRSSSFLEYRREERSSPTRQRECRSPNRRGDAEGDTKRRKLE